MKVKFRTNLGSRDAEAYGLDHTKCTAGAEVTVNNKIAELLESRGLVEPMLKGEPNNPSIGEGKPNASVVKATEELKSYKGKQKSDK